MEIQARRRFSDLKFLTLQGELQRRPKWLHPRHKGLCKRTLGSSADAPRLPSLSTLQTGPTPSRSMNIDKRRDLKKHPPCSRHSLKESSQSWKVVVHFQIPRLKSKSAPSLQHLSSPFSLMAPRSLATLGLEDPQAPVAKVQDPLGVQFRECNELHG